MEQQSDIEERERRTVVAEQMNDHRDMLEITLENGDHLWIRTPHGDVRVYITKHYRTITTWVDDVDFVGFYNTKTTKKTSSVSGLKVKHVRLTPQ